jgi:DNA-directed RNA polymerase delta subunit
MQLESRVETMEKEMTAMAKEKADKVKEEKEEVTKAMEESTEDKGDPEESIEAKQKIFVQHFDASDINEKMEALRTIVSVLTDRIEGPCRTRAD